MPQRIIFLMNGWDSAAGGIQTVNRELASAVARLRSDLDVTVLVPTATDAERADALIQNVELIAGSRDDDWAGPMVALAKEERPASDVIAVIGHSYFSGQQAIDLRNKLFPDAVAVQFAHMSPMHLESLKEYKQDAYVIDREVKIGREVQIAAEADLVVCVGPRLHRVMHDLLGARPEVKAKVTFINCGFSDEQPSFRNAPLSPSLLCLGRTDSVSVKGLDIFAYAAGYLVAGWDHPSTRSLPRPQFVVRGAKDDGEALERRLVALAEEVGTKPTVIVRPYTTRRADLDADFRGATAFVMPSREEGFGLVACEALSLGVPAIVTENSGLAEVIREVASSHHLEIGNCVIRMTGDPKEVGRRYADAALDVILNGNKALSFANVLGERLRQVASWEGGARKLLEVLYALAAERGRKAVLRSDAVEATASQGSDPTTLAPPDAGAVLAAHRASLSAFPKLQTLGVQEAIVATFARGAIPVGLPTELSGVPVIAREGDPIQTTADRQEFGVNLFVDGQPRGTASFIHQDGAASYFLTAGHVVQFGTDLAIQTGVNRVAASVVEKDDEVDWALLRVNAPFGARDIRHAHPPVLGQRVRLLLGEQSVPGGVVSAVELSALSVQDGDGRRNYEGLFEVTMARGPPRGMSGALIVTVEGGFIGMIVAGTADTVGTRVLAIPLGAIFKASSHLRGEDEPHLAPHPGPLPALLPTSDQALRHILGQLRNLEPFNRARRRYFRGDVAPGATVVVAPVPRFGNIGAAAATTALLLDNDISQLVVVGTCGGLAPHLQALADVVVATDVIYYEPGVIGGHTPAPRMRVSGSMPPSLRHRVEAMAFDYPQGDSGPRIHLGSIASGEKVIKSADDFGELMASWRGVVAVDMESAGVFEAAASLGQDVPIAVVRGIADFADARKSDEHRDDAATNAVKVALDLIARSVKDISP